MKGLKSHAIDALAALTLLGALLSSQAHAETTLRIADQKGNMRAQLEAANALEGIPYRIEWSEFSAAAPLAEALNAGAVDAGIIGDAPLVFALAARADIKAIAVDRSDPYGTAVIVGPDSPAHDIEDLLGKQIATGRGSIGHYIALRALARHGLGPDDVRFRFMGPVDARIALQTGSVDAWATWEPYTSLAEISQHARVVANGRGLIAGNSFVVATDRALEDPGQRAALQDYLKRLQKAQQWSYTHLEEYAHKLADIIGFPVEVARKQYARRQLHWTAIDDQVVAQQQATADFYYDVGLIPEALDVDPTFDRDFTLNQTTQSPSREP